MVRTASTRSLQIEDRPYASRRGQLVKKSHPCSFGKTKMIINDQFMLFYGNMILVHITVEAPQIFHYNSLLHLFTGGRGAGQRTTSWSQFSPPTVKVPGIKAGY